LIVFRNCLGMMASVSTLAMSMGAAMPLWMRNLGSPAVEELPFDPATTEVLVWGSESSGWSPMTSRSWASLRTLSSTWAFSGVDGVTLALTCGLAV